MVRSRVGRSNSKVGRAASDFILESTKVCRMKMASLSVRSAGRALRCGKRSSIICDGTSRCRRERSSVLGVISASARRNVSRATKPSTSATWCAASVATSAATGTTTGRTSGRIRRATSSAAGACFPARRGRTCCGTTPKSVPGGASRPPLRVNLRER
uniref:(northern house mosquito) hypothetical protein n=1 Tax=Culex pipiens TaxID=7175 RepID=A0A8D8GFZ0_CULPI